MNDRERVEMLLFLLQNVDVFAWNPYEVPGVNPEFIVHKLNVDPLFPPEEAETEKSVKRTRRCSKPGGPAVEGGRSHKGDILSEMVGKHCHSEEEERQMESLCGLHRLEQGVSQGPIPNAQD